MNTSLSSNKKMRKFPSLLVVAFLTLTIVSCKDKETPKEEVPVVNPPTVKVVMHNMIGDSYMMAGEFFTRTGGESMSFDLFKYYLSHAALVSDAGDTLYLNEHTLIDQFDANRRGFSSSPSLDNLASSHFTEMIFALGVDQKHNISGDQAGDLDPVYGMIWTWSTGYIFMKHEGQFTNANGATFPLLYHLGTKNAFSPVSIPIDVHLANERSYNIHLKLDLDKVYSAVDTIGFENNNLIQSTGSDDLPWILQMRANIRQSFSLLDIEVQ